MKADRIDSLACPVDGAAPLALHNARPAAGRVETGELVCPTCGATYPIADGVPSFVAGGRDSLSDLQELERQAREREYGNNEVYESEMARLPELDAVRRALGSCRGQVVLDAGCGRGGMAAVAADAAQLVGIDFSWSGLASHSLRGAATVDLIHGDVSRLPLRDDLFDACVSTGVFHHLPTQEQRAAFLGHLRRVLKPSGRLVLTTFNWNVQHRRQGVPKEGFFDNGIFRRRFEVDELRSELVRLFTVEAIVAVQIVPPKTYRLVQLLGRRNVTWDRLWRRHSSSYVYGNLLLARCTVRPEVPGA